MSEQLEGRHPVREALVAGTRAVHSIFLARGAREKGALAEIVELAARRKVRIERVERTVLDERAETRSHQGVIAIVDPLPTRRWQDGAAAARGAGRTPLIVVLDGIEDPQNLGAIIRTSEGMGVDAVVIPTRRAAPLGAAVAKASAGAIEHVIVDQVSNLDRAVRSMREDGLWIVATALEDARDVRDCALLSEPVALVVGAEGTGVSALLRKRADAVVAIPMRGRVGSLNASVAAALIIWETARSRDLHR